MEELLLGIVCFIFGGITVFFYCQDIINRIKKTSTKDNEQFRSSIDRLYTENKNLRNKIKEIENG